jgi:hypothetical protein
MSNRTAANSIAMMTRDICRNMQQEKFTSNTIWQLLQSRSTFFITGQKDKLSMRQALSRLKADGEIVVVGRKRSIGQRPLNVYQFHPTPMQEPKSAPEDPAGLLIDQLGAAVAAHIRNLDSQIASLTAQVEDLRKKLDQKKEAHNLFDLSEKDRLIRKLHERLHPPTCAVGTYFSQRETGRIPSSARYPQVVTNPATKPEP